MSKEPIDWNSFRIRCSSLHVLFVEPQSKEAREKGDLSETAKKHLWEVYIEEKWGRSEDITTKQMEKGHLVEQEIIDILSFLDDTPYKKNEERKENEWIQGCPDIVAVAHLDDAKGSWKPKTFAPFIVNPIGKDNLYQMNGYLWLWDKPKGYISRALVNCPEMLLQNELRKLLFNMNVISDEDPGYKEAAAELIRNLTYDDIPLHERIISREVIRDESIINQIPDKVKKAREYLAWMESVHMSGRKPEPLTIKAEDIILTKIKK
jgi:hypothetical protein